MKTFAHRGASGYAPENTLASMRLALEHDIYGIEIDVHLTKDEKLVVHHDWQLGKTSTGSGFLKDLTLEEIQREDAGSWFSEKFKGEKIPSLEELLEVVPENVVLNIEAKAKAYDERPLGKKLVEVLDKTNRLDSVIVSSFNHKTLEQVRSANSNVKIGALMYSRLLDMVNYFENKFPIYSAHLSDELTDKEMVQDIKKYGAEVFVWTVNDKETAKVFEDMGIDGIFTDYPDLLK